MTDTTPQAQAQVQTQVLSTEPVPGPHAHRVLVVEDDPKIARLLVDYLLADGIDAQAVHDGRQALVCLKSWQPDLLLLDLMLPALDGLGVCRELRQFSDIPVIMLTARVDEVDRLLGLECGADDYVCKPFSPREVMARVRAQLRRYCGHLVLRPSEPVWQVDPSGLRISWRGQALQLTPVEFRILSLLLSRPGRVFSRSHILDAVHGNAREVSDRAIDSHIKNLRKKIQAVDAAWDGLASVYGVGYRLDLPN